jgi:two-component system OmpR family response regulator
MSSSSQKILTAPTGILVVESEPEWGVMLSAALAYGGFGSEIVRRGDDALEQVGKAGLEGLILDLDNANGRAREWLWNLRHATDLPIIALVSPEQVHASTDALDLGADAVLFKPFWPEELLARLRNITRRLKAGSGSPRPRPPFGANRPTAWRQLRLDPRTLTVSLLNQQVRLTPREFQTLGIFLQSDPVPVKPSELHAALFDEGARIDSNAMYVHVSKLRRKLNLLAGDRIVIRLSRKHGWSLVADLS